jgi:hypothetical protein
MDCNATFMLRIFFCISVGVFIPLQSVIPTKTATPAKATSATTAASGNIATKIQDIKRKTSISLTDMGLSQVAPLVTKNLLGSNVNNLKLPKITTIPAQVKSSNGLVLEGDISFKGTSAPCFVLLAQMIDSMGAQVIGYSIAITLPKNLKITDFSFLTELGVKQTDLDLFKIDFPAATMIISSLPHYVDTSLGTVIQPGVMIVARTNTSTLITKVKQDIRRQVGGDLGKLPFLDKIAADDSLFFLLYCVFRIRNYNNGVRR